ncbi:MerR family transcriptional regulator [Streptomyces sp. NPDC006385]|uniref:MerR family transcriptional regulator n=1 Tax=Streptomyces sp. NPDC006385 TaxID=3156761 RepID=UPI0033AB3E1B
MSGKRARPMTAGELSRRTGAPVRTLREYTGLGLICTLGRSPANYRHFTEDWLAGPPGSPPSCPSLTPAPWNNRSHHGTGELRNLLRTRPDPLTGADTPRAQRPTGRPGRRVVVRRWPRCPGCPSWPRRPARRTGRRSSARAARSRP